MDQEAAGFLSDPELRLCYIGEIGLATRAASMFEEMRRNANPFLGRRKPRHNVMGIKR